MYLYAQMWPKAPFISFYHIYRNFICLMMLRGLPGIYLNDGNSVHICNSDKEVQIKNKDILIYNYTRKHTSNHPLL